MQRLRNLVSLKKTLRNSQINSVPYVQFSNNNLDPKNKFRDTKNYDEQEKLMTPDEIKENRERASKIIWGFANLVISGLFFLGTSRLLSSKKAPEQNQYEFSTEAEIEKEIAKLNKEFKEKKDIKTYFVIKPNNEKEGQHSKDPKSLLDIAPIVNQEKK